MARKKTIEQETTEVKEVLASLIEGRRQLQEKQTVASRVGRNGGYSSEKYSKVGKYDYIGDCRPFSYDKSRIDIVELIRLCKICFDENQTFRNSILTLVQLSNSKLLVRGGDKKIEAFFKKWLKRINVWDFCNKFFTEWYRSGNLFIYKSKGEMRLSEVRKLTDARETSAKNRNIPLRYIILDPEQIRCDGAASFLDGIYYKLIGNYELERLKNPVTQRDKDLLNSLTAKQREEVKKGVNPLIELTPENFSAIFNNKQDYEAFAVPTFSPIIKQINLKNLMIQSDTILWETIDMVILHINCGTEEGVKNGYNSRLTAYITALMNNRGAGKAIITDFSTKAQFVLPDLAKVMSPDRYKDLDRDISAGLMDLFSLSDNFSSSYVKTKIYLELLRQGQDAFLTQFLIPEMEEIAEEMGWDSIPTVEFQEVSLESDNELNKFFARLYEVGFLTGDGLQQAFKDRVIPLAENNDEQQANFKKQRDKGLYEPIIGGQKNDEGRPNGATKKQTASPSPKKPASAALDFEGLSSLDKIKQNMGLMDEVFTNVDSAYKEKYKLQRLHKNHKALAETIAANIIASEPIVKWNESISEYLENPLVVSVTPQRERILEIMEQYDLPVLSAAMFYHGMQDSQNKE